MYTCHMCVFWFPQRPEVSDPLMLKLQMICDPPNMSAESQTWDLCTSNSCSLTAEPLSKCEMDFFIICSSHHSECLMLALNCACH